LDGDEEGLVGDAASGDEDVAGREGFRTGVVGELESVGLVQFEDAPVVLEHVVDQDLVLVPEETDFGRRHVFLHLIGFFEDQVEVGVDFDLRVLDFEGLGLKARLLVADRVADYLQVVVDSRVIDVFYLF
jgi:hypothetical protein